MKRFNNTLTFRDQIAGLVNIASNYLISGKEAQRHGTAHPSIVPYQVFSCKDGYILIGAGNDKQVWSTRLSACPSPNPPVSANCSQFKLFADKILCQPELADDSRFSTNGARVANREQLVEVITDTLMRKPLSHWLGLFDGLG
jgi:succinate--hydroxymethylglutarate CoA-transferase